MSDKYLIKTLEDAKAEVDRLDRSANPLAGALSVLLYAGAESARERQQLIEQSSKSSRELDDIRQDLKDLRDGTVKELRDKYATLEEKLLKLEKKEDGRAVTLKVIAAIVAFYVASLATAVTATSWFYKNIQFIVP